MADIDPSKVLAETATALAKDFLKSLGDNVGRRVSKAYSSYFESFSPYLERTYVSCTSVKTIINKESPVNIDEIYVKAKFQCDKEKVEDDGLCQHVRDGRRVIVTGFGGIGKTVFCKYLFRAVFLNSGGRIPVFFELRRINELTEKNLSAYIRISLTAEDKVLDDSTFRAMMSDGRFIFILDGFDEIPDEFKNQLQRQILELAHTYRSCGFVVSSRLDDRFASWQEFYVYKALAFEKEQTRLVIEKAKFDAEVKKEFVANIFEKRYADYKGFFSTPLLTLMMLMTYLQIKHIPDNVHVFYRYAFQTLFTLHDASKEGFQRKRRLNLSEQEFMEIFSIFCLSTYVDMEHTFSEPRCLEYIEKAKKRANANFDAKDFLVDATDAVNMLFKDGDQYTFIHRSFQEYFTAYAATHYFVKPLRQLIPRLPRRDTDSVFPMMRSMNTAVIDEFYLLPESESLSDALNSINLAREPLDILKAAGYEIEFGFRVDGKRFAPFTYMAHSYLPTDVFCHVAFMMLRDGAPSDMPAANEDSLVLPTLERLGKFLQKRIGAIENERIFDAELDFQRQCLVVKFGKYGSPEDKWSARDDVIVALEEIDWRKEILVIVPLSQKIKSRAVYVKRKLEEIRRNYRKARDTSDDILSM